MSDYLTAFVILLGMCWVYSKLEDWRNKKSQYNQEEVHLVELLAKKQLIDEDYQTIRTEILKIRNK